MSIQNRAAQFSPFAALAGYGALIHETGRLTESRRILDDYQRDELNRRLAVLAKSTEKPEVRICYFQPDGKKDGGEYLTVVGTIQKIDAHTQTILMADGVKIRMEDLWDIDGKIFSI